MGWTALALRSKLTEQSAVEDEFMTSVLVVFHDLDVYHREDEVDDEKQRRYGYVWELRWDTTQANVSRCIRRMLRWALVHVNCWAAKKDTQSHHLQRALDRL